jgi:hypothetical protein
MTFTKRITESAAATRTFGSLKVERRVLVMPTRTIPIANIASITVGTHVTPKPRLLYWLAAALFAVMVFGSMRPDFSWGPFAPTGATVILAIIMLVFAVLALWPDDKTYYLLLSSNDGTLSRFKSPDRALLEDVRNLLTDKINRADESMVFIINFEKGEIDNLAIGTAPSGHPLNGAGHGTGFTGRTAQSERPGAVSSLRPRATGAPEMSHVSHVSAHQPRSQMGGTSAPTGGSSADTFVDYSSVLPAIVEMHRFYARQPGTQHLEQKLSELELLMRAGTPTPAQKTRVRELAGDMSQILAPYPQAVELFDHIGGLVA